MIMNEIRKKGIKKGGMEEEIRNNREKDGK